VAHAAKLQQAYETIHTNVVWWCVEDKILLIQWRRKIRVIRSLAYRSYYICIKF